MTAKQFFKSNAFKSLAVLLVIVILAGALLAIFNDLLYISDEERLARSLAKIYGEEVEYETELSTKEEKVTINGYNGEVNQAYLIVSDGNYLVQTTGKGGYSGGSITIWTIFSCTGSKAEGTLEWTGIERIVYESNNKQSYIGRFTSADYSQFTEHDAEVLAGDLFGEDITVIKTGASADYTLNALTNAVNLAIAYFKQEILGLGTEIPDYAFLNWVNVNSSEFTVDKETNTVTYRLTTKQNSFPEPFTVNVKIVNGVITEYSYEGDPATKDKYFVNIDQSILDGSYFRGKTTEEILALVSEESDAINPDDLGLSTGASRSTESFLFAAAFAAANYDKILENGGAL